MAFAQQGALDPSFSQGCEEFRSPSASGGSALIAGMVPQVAGDRAGSWFRPLQVSPGGVRGGR